MKLIDWLCLAHIHDVRTAGSLCDSLIPPVKSQKDISIGCPRVPGKQKFYVLRASECGFAGHYLSAWGFLIHGAEIDWITTTPFLR